MKEIGKLDKALDEHRINRAFADAVAKLTNWPSPAQIIELMPRRPEMERVDYKHSEEPVPDMLKQAMDLIGDGKTTRRQWNLLMQSMYKEYKTRDTLGPTLYASMCERHGLDMDEIAHTAGLGKIINKHGIEDKDLPF